MIIFNYVFIFTDISIFFSFDSLEFLYGWDFVLKILNGFFVGFWLDGYGNFYIIYL